MPKGILQKLLNGERRIAAHVQPMYRLRDNRRMAQEYLIRHLDSAGQAHPVGAILQAPELDPADRLALDLRFLEETFRTLATAEVSDLLHFVNLEPLSLEAPGFWEALPRWLEALPFPPDQVVLEFTEGQRIHDVDALRGYSARLRDAGLRIAVDDLGAGVASLSHMARLAPDFIKADRSLVEQVHRRPYQAALLNALAHFANRMRIGFIAEGIETLEELEAVMDADVPWGQGYVLGQPWPTEPRPLTSPPQP